MASTTLRQRPPCRARLADGHAGLEIAALYRSDPLLSHAVADVQSHAVVDVQARVQPLLTALIKGLLR